MPEKKIKRRRSIIEWLETIAFSLAIAVLLFTFIFRIATVTGASMAPTLNETDVLFSSNLFYTIQRGDIVVVDGYNNYGEPLIKRVIAVGGDEINIDFTTGSVYVNGALQDEPYISAPTTRQFDVIFPLVVPEGKLFVMGDNRPISLDSRDNRVGFIDERDILGHVLFRIFPFSSFGKVV